MTVSNAANALISSSLVSWKLTGGFQQTLAGCIQRIGKTLHSGKDSMVKLWPELAGKGRYFDFRSKIIPAFIVFAEKESPLCTTLCKEGCKVRTVEHLLSALEAKGVDNCRIEIKNLDSEDAEVPIFDGSASEWLNAIEEVGVTTALDECGGRVGKMAPHLNEPIHVCKNDSFLVAFPAPKVHTTYGIDFNQVSAIGCQWFSSAPLGEFYANNIASARTFCVYEQVEVMRKAGLIKGGSINNAIICSADKGWLNPPLRFDDEPCRHKVLDLVGDLSLFAQFGNQGLPMAHIVAFKGGHALHADFVRRLAGIA
ncbi:probable UDP-3-O-acyl-N-acetylglucosamine deacetylase 2 isoform X2 [Carica papaya]|uniref:probable UDP-3-O-acyl-N-acetylglucosamine deacetylase 2 isoform X2 n=1 Tax=Carica papaya TaxID=3649 RepID=UPI000B8C90CE|nr:probable UDP-3-O-acyl-N-acetylglucosamine deacetylase 2 isoform X2 [Carica papaya]